MNPIKSPAELDLMQKGGAKLGAILTRLLDEAQPGVVLKDIDDLAKKLISEGGGTPSFMTVSGYEWATCLCVDDVVVHGVPSQYALKEGDVLTVDVGLLYKGLHTDTAWTKVVRGSSFQVPPATQKFLAVGEEAMWQAIGEAKVGNRIGHISQAIQRKVEGAGYSVMRTLIGHGVGHELHEDPPVPGFVSGRINSSPILREGMTLAIEVIYAMGKKDVIYDTGDGWSIATKDGSLSAVFEHTIAITQGDPMVLTMKRD